MCLTQKACSIRLGGKERREGGKERGRETTYPRGPPMLVLNPVLLLTVQLAAPCHLKGTVPESPHLEQPLGHSFPSPVLYSSEKLLTMKI